MVLQITIAAIAGKIPAAYAVQKILDRFTDITTDKPVQCTALQDLHTAGGVYLKDVTAFELGGGQYQFTLYF